ncbi:S8 family serine peptidase [Halorussus lipolyticus]|uniref:S8 family serine peptidase n=1 Tax=Halorussus lipolyticus TaxID=3034024 RepID=UPI0023E815BD|nr:S8 family serine peptidase [Halorussus sp. DT80]
MASLEFRRALAIAVLGVVTLAGGLGLLATSLSADTDRPATAADVSSVGPTVSTLHDAGATGENVTVGVLDVTGFDTSSAILDGRVADARAFAPGESVPNDGNNAHGTETAETVARVAPSAGLHLATFDSLEGYRRAVEWLVAEDADVIVAPVSFYGMTGDGTSAVADVAERATRKGVVFVSPAGNLGQSHWTGRYRRVENGTLAFEEGTRNYLRNGGRDVTVWLSWDDAHHSEDYTARLYWTDGSESRLVARSHPYSGDGVPNERIVARVQSGTYYVTVEGPANATGARLRLSSPTHDFQHVEPAGSIVAPASDPAVLAVGAYDSDAEQVAPFSSRGPTPDGRDGIDLLAPSNPAVVDAGHFGGTSASTAYVGGVAALVRDRRPELSPRGVERRLETTAVEAGDPGPDSVAGHGLLRPLRAVGVERNATT